MKTIAMIGLIGAASCANGQSTSVGRMPVTNAPDATTIEADAADSAPVSAETSAPDSAVAQREPDGNDPRGGVGVAPKRGHWERVGRTWASLTRVCDLTPFAGALYAAHAVQPLGIDGATITRLARKPSVDGGVRDELTIAFDWNRAGEPKEGGGSGQGFIRLRSIEGRLFVPDADPPHDGFGLLDHGTEGYVFISDAEGRFAKPTGEHQHPPALVRDGGAGVGVLPRAYHDLDVIEYRGRLLASTGSVPPGERAWSGPSSPGALHEASPDRSRWTYRLGYPTDATRDVWRLTFMTRFRDRLYAGIQEYYPRELHDYVVLNPPPERDGVAPEDVRAVRATELGGAETLRWFADAGALYWITIDKDGQGRLRVTRDGDVWTTIDVPAEAGRPADVTRMGDDLLLLTARKLYRLELDQSLVEIAASNDAKLFAVDDYFCAPPLAVYEGSLYAGSQKDGALYRLVAD